jgi:hypothetical protein
MTNVERRFSSLAIGYWALAIFPHPSSFILSPLPHPLLQVAEAGRGHPHGAAGCATVLLVLGHGLKM